MPSSQLKRVEKSIEAMRSDPNTPKTAETTEALQDLVDAVRAVESRLRALEGKGRTAEMELPNRGG
jgi:predicted flap endonuclease-1-like 5' DNA nuclease